MIVSSYTIVGKRVDHDSIPIPDPPASSEGVRELRICFFLRSTPIRPSYPSSSFINSARRRSMAFKRVVSVLASLLRSANSFWSFFWCRWSGPLWSRTRDSTSCRSSRYQGLPCMLLSRNCSLPARIAVRLRILHRRLQNSPVESHQQSSLRT